MKRCEQKVLGLLATFLLATLTASIGHTAEIIWASAGNGNWDTTSNWVGGVAPTSTDTVSLRGWEPLAKSGWAVTASNTYMTAVASNTKDGKRSTVWSSGLNQASGQWIVIDLGSVQTFGGVKMETPPAAPNDYARGYDVYVSTSNGAWGSPIASGTGSGVDVEISFASQTFQWIKIQLNAGQANWWQIAEITVWGTGAGTQFASAGYTMSASANAGGNESNAVDWSNTTRWSPGVAQANGQWLKVDFGADQTFVGLSMDAYDATNDYPRGYNVEVATNAAPTTWVSVATGNPTTAWVLVTFAAQTARYIRITQTGSAGNLWSVYELRIFGTPTTLTTTASKTLGGITHTSATTLVQATNHTLTINGDWNMSAGTFTGGNSFIDFNGGDLNLSGGTFTSTSDVMMLDQAFNKTGGTFNHNSGRVMFNGSSDQTFATGGATFYDLIVNDGLRGYWKLDEGTTPVADSSGYGHSGTLSNTPTWGAGPTLGFTNSNAMILNGTTQYGRVTRTGILEPSAITIAAWVKRNGTQVQYAQIVCKAYTNGVSSPYSSYDLHLNDSNVDSSILTFPTGHSGPTIDKLSTATGAIPDGTWTHVAATYDPAANSKKIYINGVLSTSKALSTAVLYDTSTMTGDLYLGQNGGSSQWFKGSMDDVRIYKRALSAAEIYSLYIGNQPGTSVATQTMTGAPTVANDLTIASGTLSVGANNITVSGNWNNYGGIFTAGTGTVTMNATTAKVIRSAGQPFKNLTLNGSGATWTLEDWLKVTSSLTMTNGALAPGSYAVHASDLNMSSGTFTAGTSTVVIDTTTDVTQSTGFSFNNLRIETPDETSLAGYWKFDEGQGTVIHDASGAGNDGSLNGSTNWVAAASNLPSAIDFDNHAALSFNGTTAYGSLPLSGQPATTAAKTVAMWINLSSTAGTQDFFSVLNSGPGTNYVIGVRGGAIAVAKGGGVVMASVAVPSTGSWHHVAYTYDGVSTNKIYLDGTTVGTGSSSPAGTNATISIGSREGSTEMYSGQLDDLRVYSVALTAAQVQNLASGGYAGLGSNDTVTLGANLTVNHVLAIDNGTLDTSGYTVNAAATDSTQTATVNAGTLKVGSNTVTFNGGLTVGKLGTVTENTAGGKIALGTGEALEFDEPAGAAVGFPTAAFDWNSFTFWREYVTYSSYVGATTADTVLALTADGGTKYSWQLPSGKGSLVGTPRWNTEGAVHYIYLITTLGYVYKVKDDGSTLATEVTGFAWPYRNGASATATSPLGNDSSNLYWSGNDGSGNPKFFSLTLAGALNSAFTVAATVSAAPALATVSGTNYVFFAIANVVYQETLTLASGWTNVASATTAVNGRVTVYNSIVYFPETNGKVWALNATNSGAPTTRWSYQDITMADHVAACTGGTHVCPAVSNIYVDIAQSRICFGDADGHIYVLNSSGTVLHAGFPWQISASDVFSVAPVSRNGVLMIGTAAGKVYEIDENNGTTRALTRTYTLPGGGAVSSISFNPSANAGSGAYTVGTSDGKLFYIVAGTDPTSGSP